MASLLVQLKLKQFKQTKNLNKKFMKVSIKLHEPQTAENYYRPLKVLLEEVRECTSDEFEIIRAEYESRKGKYGMKNAALDHCWYIA